MISATDRPTVVSGNGRRPRAPQRLVEREVRAAPDRYRNPIIEDGTVVIAISQSGETADTLAALRHAKHLGAIADQSIGLTPEGRRLWTLQKELLAARGHATDVH